jgi:hypothetical protein|eukprot:scaffold5055_cov210-Alexandrium_tamarense.AAC.5
MCVGENRSSDSVVGTPRGGGSWARGRLVGTPRAYVALDRAAKIARLETVSVVESRGERAA